MRHLKKNPHWIEVLYKLQINRFRATRLLNNPYTSRARFYNQNSPFLKLIMLSLSKNNTNVGSNYTYFKERIRC